MRHRSPTNHAGPTSVAGQPRQDIEEILHPRSIAVVGASTNPDKQGYIYVRMLKEFGFKGAIYPVNPKAKEIAGLKCYPSLKEVPRPLDYVISAVPAALVPQLVDDALGLDVRAIHLFTGRLAEAGTDEAVRRQQKLVEVARKGGIRIIGPNCMGIYHPCVGISFRLNFPKRSGPVGIVSQSGNNAFEFVYRASQRGVFFSKVISYGNASDLDESDFLEYLAHDPETSIIATYIEGIKDGGRFFKTLKTAASAKPVILLKGGRTGAGTRAAASHTASLAGVEEVWDAAVKQAGALWVDSLEEMADMVVAFLYMRVPHGRRTAVICGGGGGSVFSADVCEANGLQVPPLPDDIRDQLKAHLPETWFMVSNPIDVSAVDGEGLMSTAARLMAQHSAFDLMIVDPDLEWHFERPENQERIKKLMDRLIEVKRSFDGPMAMVIRPSDSSEHWRWQTTVEVQTKAWEAGIPVFPSMARAAHAADRLMRYNARVRTKSS
ncbi:MAG: acetate--CoA ligase family protein [Dehalococcoidia bacterium]